ncbi:MAG: ABC transporter permease [Cyclobacteriaceae bacterium]
MKGSKPPKLPLRLLKWFCKPEYHKDIEGDLLELYERRVETLGLKQANKKLTKDILLLFRPGILRSFRSNQRNNSMALLKHNLIFTFRNFKRHKSSFFINLIGLSTGLACASLIYLWVNDELKIDKFHQNDSRLYQIMNNGIDGDIIDTSPHTAIPLAQALQEEISEVEMAVSVLPANLISGYLGDFKISTNDSPKITAMGNMAQGNFFKMFSYQILRGDRESTISEPKTIAISESTAVKLFGSIENSIDKTIDWQLVDFKGQAKVTAVFENLTHQSTSQFDFVLSFDAWIEIVKNFGTDPKSYDNQAPSTYVLLHPETNPKQFHENIRTFVQKKHKNSKSELLPIQYSSRYLYGNFENGQQAGSRIKYVKLFSAIAIFILIIACINFMNLSTARASRRMKEVGIKKALGITRKNLAFQFLAESLILTFLSSVLALLLVLIALPQFGLIAGKQLFLEIDITFIMLASGTVILTGLLSGSYPALYLSGFDTIAVLKGKLQSALGEIWVRKGLVMFQFVISIVLISGVLVVYKQVAFIQNKNLGYNKEHVVFFPREGRASEKEDTFLSELSQIPGIISASSIGGNLTGQVSSTNGFSWEGKDPDLTITFAQIPSNYNIIETLGIEIIDGRSFSKDFNDSHSLILNETAISIMGLDDPVGKTVTLWNGNYKIIGIVKDFHVESLHKNVKPLLMYLSKNETFTFMARIKPDQQLKTLASIETFYKEFNPGFPLELKFLDKNYSALYASENRVSSLSKYFAALAILISCLGLLGLVAFTAERRTKEIGIRKILGLSELGIVRLISSEFMRLVFVSVTIALPISYFLTKQWLAQFAYRIQLDWWLFAFAGLSALLVAGAIACWQTLKIARANPVDCIKDE